MDSGRGGNFSREAVAKIETRGSLKEWLSSKGISGISSPSESPSSSIG